MTGKELSNVSNSRLHHLGTNIIDLCLTLSNVSIIMARRRIVVVFTEHGNRSAFIFVPRVDTIIQFRTEEVTFCTEITDISRCGIGNSGVYHQAIFDRSGNAFVAIILNIYYFSEIPIFTQIAGIFLGWEELFIAVFLFFREISFCAAFGCRVIVELVVIFANFAFHGRLTNQVRIIIV